MGELLVENVLDSTILSLQKEFSMLDGINNIIKKYKKKN